MRSSVYWLLTAIISLLILSASTQAQSPPDAQNDTQDALRIEENGQTRLYRLRTDQLYIKDPQGRWQARSLGTQVKSKTQLHRQKRDITRKEKTDAALILEPMDRPATPYNRRLITSRILVELKKPQTQSAAEIMRQAITLAQKYQATSRPDPSGTTGVFIFTFPPEADLIQAREQLQSDPAVHSAELILARIAKKKALPNDPLVNQQWHIKNNGTGGAVAGMDANVSNVWGTFGGSGTRGSGLRIGIVDDGVQYTHPDISPNYDTTTDFDWNDNTPNDPAPDLNSDFHGTSCAGVAAARGNNSIGVSGIAPEATLVGLRLIADFFDDQDTADAINYLINSGASTIPIKSNSWGPDDDGSTKEAPGPLAKAALQNAAQNGRNGKGTILVWAGGNGGGPEQDNSNYDGFANSIYTIAVAAMSDQGKRADYSEPGANLIVTAPSSSVGRPGIVTTDLTGNNGYNYSGLTGELSDRSYTNDFGGTSSATPVVAGVCALLLQTNPNLGWRDVQEILMRSATKNDPTDSDWIVNAAGIHFNHKYGAGLVNAQAALALAATWTNLPPATTQTATNSTAGAIPDNSPVGITRSFSIPSNLRVEHVTVTVNITHNRRGHLAIDLISPQGTISRLSEKHGDTTANYSNWTFMTVRNFGENSIGNWTLIIKDLTGGFTGNFQNATLTIYGTPTGPVNQPPQITSASIIQASPAFSDQSLALNISASDPESDPITYTYQWQNSNDSLTFTNALGKTAATLPADPANKGLLWRCRITPHDGNSSGAPFFTAPILVVAKPPQTAVHGQAYTYDMDLPVQTADNHPIRSAVINEFSQGPSGSSEWIEILVLRDSDLRGWKVMDRNSAEITFLNVSFWQSIPAGTIITIYNGNATKDPIIPADDFVLLPDKRLILKHNETAYFSGSAWPALSNSSQEAILIRDSNGVLIDGISFNGDAAYAPQLGTVGAATAAGYQGNSESTMDQVSAWLIYSASTATPGVGNNATNIAFINDLRSGALNSQVSYQLAGGSDPLPAGLSLHASSGLISGTVHAPAGAFAHLVLQASNGSVTQSFAYDFLVGSQHNVYQVPANKTFSVLGPVNLFGYFQNFGILSNPQNYPITIQTLYSAWAAAQLNNPLAPIFEDPDEDEQVNLLEYAFDSNPLVKNAPPWQQQFVTSGGQSYQALSYPRRAAPTDILYFVEVSDDLQTWTPATAYSSGPVNPATGIYAEVMRDTIASSGATRRFIRVRVQKF
jgi:subtilisin-like proprotein convertase family protein